MRFIVLAVDRTRDRPINQTYRLITHSTSDFDESGLCLCASIYFLCSSILKAFWKKIVSRDSLLFKLIYFLLAFQACQLCLKNYIKPSSYDGWLPSMSLQVRVSAGSPYVIWPGCFINVWRCLWSFCNWKLLVTIHEDEGISFGFLVSISLRYDQSCWKQCKKTIPSFLCHIGGWLGMS